MAISSAPYEIIRSPEVCAQSGRAFEEGEEHIAALIESPGDEPLVRVLYSIEAWEQGPTIPEGASVFGFWKRTHQPAQEHIKPLVSPEEMLDLFEQLGQATDHKQLAFRYLLTLILMRKKKLVYERSTPARADEPGCLVVRLRQRGGQGELFEVVDPGLDDETIAQATEELGQVMNLDLDGA
ncbi:MAG: hypothetical protein ACWA5W_07760 [Phycisphaerales bacterium]